VPKTKSEDSKTAIAESTKRNELFLFNPSFEVKDISFVTPKRGKFKIGILPCPDPEEGGITVESVKTEDTFAIFFKDIGAVQRPAPQVSYMLTL